VPRCLVFSPSTAGLKRSALLPRPRYIGGRDIVFDRFLVFVFLFIFLYISFFLCFFVSRITRKRWTDLHEIFGEGVECPWDDLITFLVNSEKPCDATMRNTGPRGRGLLCFSTTACSKILLDNRVFFRGLQHETTSKQVAANY